MGPRNGDPSPELPIDDSGLHSFFLPSGRNALSSYENELPDFEYKGSLIVALWTREKMAPRSLFLDDPDERFLEEAEPLLLLPLADLSVHCHPSSSTPLWTFLPRE